nr:DnaD domain protein [Oscillospiraceae bacterium]
EYTRADMARALEGREFSSLTGAVEDKLGKKLTTPDLAILLGLYDQLGLPPDVIYLLVSFCAERVTLRYGKGRQPTLRQIEKEGYIWARLGLMDQESAAAYIKKYHRSREAVPKMMRLLRLDDRKPSPSEEKYILSWVEMGFEDRAIELAYDKTVLKCKELKWPYMNKILCSWHGKGLHTVAGIEAEDKPRQAVQPQKSDADAAREDMARMEKYRQQLRREMEGS